MVIFGFLTFAPIEMAHFTDPFLQHVLLVKALITIIDDIHYNNCASLKDDLWQRFHEYVYQRERLQRDMPAER